MPLSQQPHPIGAAAITRNDATAGDETTRPSTTSKSVTLDLGQSQNSPAHEQSNGSQAAAAADAVTACTEDVACDHAALSPHADSRTWLPEQLERVQQQYAAVGHREGLTGDALLGQRVAFALLEDFHQHDRRREVDTLLAGLHTGK